MGYNPGGGSLLAPIGTRMLFQQTTPPTGWSKEVGAAFDNVALRLVTGAVGSAAGNSFTTALVAAIASAAIAPGTSDAAAGNTGATTLAIAEIPAHPHSMQSYAAISSGAGVADAGGAAASVYNTGNAGGGGSHLHTLGSHTHAFTATHAHNVTLNVSYRDMIIAEQA